MFQTLFDNFLSVIAQFQSKIKHPICEKTVQDARGEAKHSFFVPQLKGHYWRQTEGAGKKANQRIVRHRSRS